MIQKTLHHPLEDVVRSFIGRRKRDVYWFSEPADQSILQKVFDDTTSVVVEEGSLVTIAAASAAFAGYYPLIGVFWDLYVPYDFTAEEAYGRTLDSNFCGSYQLAVYFAVSGASRLNFISVLGCEINCRVGRRRFGGSNDNGYWSAWPMKSQERFVTLFTGLEPIPGQEPLRSS